MARVSILTAGAMAAVLGLGGAGLSQAAAERAAMVPKTVLQVREEKAVRRAWKRRMRRLAQEGHVPHQGTGERECRKRQIAAGQLTEANGLAA